MPRVLYRSMERARQYREAARLRIKPIRAVTYRVFGQPEGWSALHCLLWAAWAFFLPAQRNVEQLYEILHRLLTNTQWVAIALVIGLLQGAAVVRNKRYFRGVMAFVACVFWGVLAHGLYLGNSTAPAAAVYLGDALLNIVLCTMLLCPRR